MSRPITSEILDREDLTSSEKLVLIAISSHGHTAFPSQKRLARMTSLSVRTVKSAVASLRTKKAILTIAGRKSLTYRVVLTGATIAPMGQPLHPTSATIAPLEVQPLHPNSSGNSSLNSSPEHPDDGRRTTHRAPKGRVVPF